MPHFTLAYGPLGPLIDAFVGVREPRLKALQAANQPLPQPVIIKALVDTGASHSAIDPAILTTALQLSPRRIAKTITPSTGSTPHKCYTYDVSIHVPMGSATSLFSKMAWEVSGLALRHQGFDMLLGRDILASGILVYDGKARTFALAF